MMKFYQRRLVALAKNRAAAGRLGEINSGWRELYDGFVPDFRLRKQFGQGLRRLVEGRMEKSHALATPRSVHHYRLRRASRPKLNEHQQGYAE